MQADIQQKAEGVQDVLEAIRFQLTSIMVQILLRR